MRKNPHGVFDGHSADALQPAPHLHPEVVGLRRDLVEEEEPTSACGLAHGGPPGWTTRLDTLSGARASKALRCCSDWGRYALWVPGMTLAFGMPEPLVQGVIEKEAVGQQV